MYLKIKNINTLLKRIALRGRDYEKNITYNYLYELNRKYEDWIKKWDGNKLIIDAEIDMKENNDYLKNIEEKIMENLKKLQK